LASGFNSPISSPLIQNSPPTGLIQKDLNKGSTLNPVIPQFIQQQIAAETKESVLAALRGAWSPDEYNAFIEGLVAYSEEKDINTRCQLISRHYLPRYSPEQIKQCFMVLSSVAKAKERDEPRDELAGMEARVRAEMYGQYFLVKPDTDNSLQFRHPSLYRYPPQVPQPAPAVSYPQQFTEPAGHLYAFGNGGGGGMQTTERRASYPLDPFSRVKHANDAQQDAFLSLEHGMWSGMHANPDEFQPHDHL